MFSRVLCAMIMHDSSVVNEICQCDIVVFILLSVWSFISISSSAFNLIVCVRHLKIKGSWCFYLVCIGYNECFVVDYLTVYCDVGS